MNVSYKIWDGISFFMLLILCPQGIGIMKFFQIIFFIFNLGFWQSVKDSFAFLSIFLIKSILCFRFVYEILGSFISITLLISPSLFVLFSFSFFAIHNTSFLHIYAFFLLYGYTIPSYLVGII